jgi:hypothetical protein
LKEQAGYLMAKTKNVLSAEVRTRQDKGQIEQNFYIVAPALNNYRYKLLSVIHDVLYYPLTVSSQIHGEFEGQMEITVESEDDFMKAIHTIFQHPDTARIISSLLSQSLEE